MATPAAQPLELPLPGGREGATVRLHPINTGDILMRVAGPRPPRRGPAKLPRTFISALRRDLVACPVPVFLVEHPEAGPLLVDAGYDPSAADDPRRTMPPISTSRLFEQRASGRSVRELVRERGVDPEDIGLVLLTHLHFDHTSGVGEFPDATFVTDATEWRAAHAPVGPPYHKPTIDSVHGWRLVDLDGPRAEPADGFARTLDVFGDGSVRLVATRGHSPGHLAVLLRLEGRQALIAGDAVTSAAQLGERLIEGVVLNQRQYLESLDEIRGFAQARPDAVVIPGHDAAAWERLEPVY